MAGVVGLLSLLSCATPAAPYSVPGCSRPVFIDSGCSTNVFDEADPTLGKWWRTRDEPMDTLGGKAPANNRGTIKVPHVGQQEAILAPAGTPNCTSMGRQVLDHTCGFSWFPEGFTPQVDPRDPRFRGVPVFWPKSSIVGNGAPVECETHYYVPHFPPNADTNVARQLQRGLEKAGYGQAIKIITSMSDDALEGTATHYAKYLHSAAGIAIPQSAQEEIRSILYALAGRPPKHRKRVKGPYAPSVTAQERESILKGAPELTFVDEAWDNPRVLPDGWWIGSSQLELVDGSLEVTDHEEPIEHLVTPPAERKALFTGRRFVKLWSVAKADWRIVAPLEEEHPEEAKISVLPPGARKARQADHVRYEKGSRKAEAHPLPPDHYLSHEPADARCPVCEVIKLTKAGAGKVAEGTGVKEKIDLKYLDVVGIDLYGPLPEQDIDGCYYFMVTEDVKTGLAKGESLAEKSAEAAWETAESLYPGTRMDIPTTFPRAWSADNGLEWKGVFLQKTKERGGMLRLGIPYRSQTKQGSSGRIAAPNAVQRRPC